MNNNYIKSLLTLLVVLTINISYAQSSLTNTDYGATIQTYLDQKKESLNLISADLSDLYVNKQFRNAASEIFVPKYMTTNIIN